jgi:thioredoxin:protein disulfide reductase
LTAVYLRGSLGVHLFLLIFLEIVLRKLLIATLALTIIVLAIVFSASLESAFAASLTSRSIALFPLAFLTGILAAATPCVLPMIPIVLSTLGVGDGVTRRTATLRSGAFVGGIVATYTALGIFAGLTGSLVSAAFTHAATHIGIGALFIGLGLSSLGLFDIRLPKKLQNRFHSFGGDSIPGAAAAGMVSGLLALPCVGPILAGILAVVGAEGSASYGAALLAVHALGFGLPFFALGVGLMRLPKRGPWMEHLKRVVGIALLLGAFWFLRNAFPILQRPSGHLALGIISLIIGTIGTTVMIGYRQTPNRLARAASISFGLVAALFGGFVTINVLATSTLHDWCVASSTQPCLPAACATHDLTVIDFNAEWCTSCKRLEQTTLQDPSVSAALKPYGRISVNIDTNVDVADQYGVQGLPTLAFVNSSCEEVHRIEGYVDSGAFLEQLGRARQRVQ